VAVIVTEFGEVGIETSWWMIADEADL